MTIWSSSNHVMHRNLYVCMVEYDWGEKKIKKIFSIWVNWLCYWTPEKCIYRTKIYVGKSTETSWDKFWKCAFEKNLKRAFNLQCVKMDYNIHTYKILNGFEFVFFTDFCGVGYFVFFSFSPPYPLGVICRFP